MDFLFETNVLYVQYEHIRVVLYSVMVEVASRQVQQRGLVHDCILPLLNGIMESVSESRLGFLVGETNDLLGKECPSRMEVI